MKSFQCRHDLVHVFDRHECDGCCAQVRLEPAQKPFKMSLSDCKKHNWVYDEFDEPCPLCEAVNAERERITELLDNLACQNPYCRKFKLMQSHTGCKAVRHHIKLIKGENK